ncbi:hypothetical protein BDV98DRAFT_573618 [Pterulicium gracile]|uniref:NADH:flavin oxidoreductase/NADH oxidase N-terminal domain-containing protein n=1 Tax=Pterulicium gracile TaxID=1884261 RepID=A0A5C3Q7F5_9AGAR|nr:hypothetical protein BDV98DRAFT_573618 [Pterula gracilis]
MTIPIQNTTNGTKKADPAHLPLFEPLTMGGLTLPNRIVMSALTRNRASVPSLVPSDLNVEYYAQRARGGPGLIIAEGALTSWQGTQWPYAPGLWTDEQVAGWKKVVDAVHKEGTVIFAQLWHVGRTSRPDHPLHPGCDVLAPSAVQGRGGLPFRHMTEADGYAMPTEIADPQAIIDEYKHNAVNAKKAGFDGAEIMAGTGYLIQQFIDSGVNKRMDKWGGSVENRCRFALEVVKAVREVFPEGRVGIKLSPSGGMNDVGMPLPETIETYTHLLTALDTLGLGYICIARDIPFFDTKLDNKMRAISHDTTKTYRSSIKHTHLMINGDLSPDLAASYIAGKDGLPQVELTSFGRPWIVNPDFARRLEHGVELAGLDQLLMASVYGSNLPEEESRVGYTSYPEGVYV